VLGRYLEHLEKQGTSPEQRQRSTEKRKASSAAKGNERRSAKGHRAHEPKPKQPPVGEYVQGGERPGGKPQRWKFKGPWPQPTVPTPPTLGPAYPGPDRLNADRLRASSTSLTDNLLGAVKKLVTTRKGRLGLGTVGLGAGALAAGLSANSGSSPAPAPAPAPALPTLPAPPVSSPTAASPAPTPAQEGAGRLPGRLNQISGAMKGLGDLMPKANVLSSAGSWVQGNPRKAALMGLGIPAGAYGLSKLVGGGDKGEKSAADRWRGDRRGVLKYAADVKRKNSVTIVRRYLTKLASARDAQPLIKVAFAVVEHELQRGENIHTAFKRAFPGMPAERRGMLAARIVKQSLDDLLKSAMSTCEPKTFNGSPDEANDWMRSNS
jgi:hypothetical protein